jgi:hypothetical protein
MPRKRIIKMTAVAGIVGPILFATALLSLTVLQHDFMVGIGWQPWRDPAGAWPSGLALGPYGWAQNASFIVSGVLLMIFATGLHLGVTGGLGSRAGPGLLLVSGTAMALMGFETDPIRRTGPRTLHGLVHDLAFVLFVLTLLLALFFLWRRLRSSALWRGYARYTLATGFSATLLLLLPGVSYYLFLAVVLAWFELLALRLWESTGHRDSRFQSRSAGQPGFLPSTSRMQLPPGSASPPYWSRSRRRKWL